MLIVSVPPFQKSGVSNVSGVAQLLICTTGLPRVPGQASRLDVDAGRDVEHILTMTQQGRHAQNGPAIRHSRQVARAESPIPLSRARPATPPLSSLSVSLCKIFIYLSDRRDVHAHHLWIPGFSPLSPPDNILHIYKYSIRLSRGGGHPHSAWRRQIMAGTLSQPLYASVVFVYNVLSRIGFTFTLWLVFDSSFLRLATVPPDSRVA